MKLFVICSKRFYGRIPMIKEVLEEKGHEVVLPNCYDKPNTEEEIRLLGHEEHAMFKKKMFSRSEKITKNIDGVLVLNFDKGTLKNYIGGATFLEMYDALRLEKDIYMWNPIPKSILTDEIEGFSPTIINGDLNKIPTINKIQKDILRYITKMDKEYGQMVPKHLLDIAKYLDIELAICHNEISMLLERNMLDKKQLGNIDYFSATDFGLYQIGLAEKPKTKILK